MKKLSPVLVYGVLALLVLGPLLAPGYVFTLDLMFAPNIKVAQYFYGMETLPFGGLPYFLFLKGASFVVPMWVMQKMLLFFALFLAGISAHSLFPAKSTTGKYYAGLAYMLNPFVFARFMAGHLFILFGYALLPLFVKASLDFLEKPGLRRALLVALQGSLIAVFTTHILLLAILVFIVLWLFKVVEKKAMPSYRRSLLPGIAVIIFSMLLLNLYWLLPTLGGDTSGIGRISYDDLQVFTAAKSPGMPNVAFSIASMHGFWLSGYRYISNILPLWFLVYAAMLYLSVLGVVTFFSHKGFSSYTRGLVIIGLIALVLGTGISVLLFSPVYRLLFDNFLVFRGLRDSQKFVALLALCYSQLGGLGVASLKEQLGSASRWQVKALLPIAALVLPILYSLNMFWGLNGTLSSIDYPAQWKEAKGYLDQKEGEFNILFLPWHQYMVYSWTNQNVLGPAKEFFTQPVIQSESLEVGKIGNRSTKPTQHYVEFLLNQKGKFQHLGALLVPINVRYIILAKETDYKDYGFLYQQKDLELVLENSKLVIFQNQRHTALLYQSQEQFSVKNWEELLRAVGQENLDLMGAAFSLGEENPPRPTSSFSSPSVNYRRLSPIKYEVTASSGKYLVFSEPFDAGWSLDREKPQSNLGITNVFSLPANTKILLYYSRFNLILLAYAISLGSFLLILALLIAKRKAL